MTWDLALMVEKDLEGILHLPHRQFRQFYHVLELSFPPEDTSEPLKSSPCPLCRVL